MPLLPLNGVHTIFTEIAEAIDQAALRQAAQQHVDAAPQLAEDPLCAQALNPVFESQTLEGSDGFGVVEMPSVQFSTPSDAGQGENMRRRQGVSFSRQALVQGMIMSAIIGPRGGLRRR